MEVPIMSRISSFEAGFGSLQAPSLLSKLLRLSGSDEAASLRVFMWTWGPLVLALVAALGSLVRRRAKLLLLLLRAPKADAFTQIKDLPDGVDDDVVVEDDDVSSCCSSSDGNGAVSNEDDGVERLEMDFCVAGSSRRRRLSDHFSRSVVKLWDSSFTSSIVAFDSIAGGKARTFTAGSPAVVVSAGYGCRATAEVRDERAGRGEVAVVAEWAADDAAFVGVGVGCGEVVFEGGDGGGAGGRRLTVLDLRMAGSPLPPAAEMVWYGAVSWTQRSAEMAGCGLRRRR